VFPEERLLMEILLQKPLAHLNDSVWASCAGRYYINGKSLLVPREMYHYKNAGWVREALAEHAPENNGIEFKASVERFIAANQEHLAAITQEAVEFTRQAATDYLPDRLYVSFSGGKDSTVCADIVKRALAPQQPMFIFGDTTLEFPQTYEYVERFKKVNPNFHTARNNEQDFFEVSRDIGVPSRYLRWCCTMFKTGPIAKRLSQLFANQMVLSFTGVRAAESKTRSKFDRLTTNTESQKIQQQLSARPIFHWKEADVWLYILSEEPDFNQAYRLGFNRLGCWPCPNGWHRSTFLNHVYVPDAAKWREQLFEFAREAGKTVETEKYIDGLYWTYRQGGAGLKASADVVASSMGCTTEEQAKLYALNKPINESFYSFFTPLGIVSQDAGRKLIDETLVLDPESEAPILSIQPFNSNNYAHAVKVKVLTEKGQLALHRKVVYQVRKYNACRNCGKCESVCMAGAKMVLTALMQASATAAENA